MCLSSIHLQFISCPLVLPWWWSRLLMDAAILIVVWTVAVSFIASGVIWPQSHFSSECSDSLPSNEFRDGSQSHLKLDRVRVTTKKGDVMFAGDTFTMYYLHSPYNPQSVCLSWTYVLGSLIWLLTFFLTRGCRFPALIPSHAAPCHSRTVVN